MGLRYTLFVSSYSQLIRYFLIQAISSFSILLSYIYQSPLFLTISFFIKLSIFPFFAWYINVAYCFPNFILWISGTLHKLPVLLLLSNFNLLLNSPLLWGSIVLTTIVSGVIILSITDFRILLVLSSVGNNSWLLLSQITRIALFLLFFFTYTCSLYMVLFTFKGLSKYSIVTTPTYSPYSLSLWVTTLSGIPPFPIFFLKLLIVLNLLANDGLNYLILLFLVSNSFILIGYLQSLIKYYIYSFSSISHYIIKY